MFRVKTARELGLGEPKLGYEWEAGWTPCGDSEPGWWSVLKRAQDWAVLFHSAEGAQYIIQTFTPTEAGERAAKIMALELVDTAWSRNISEKSGAMHQSSSGSLESSS